MHGQSHAVVQMAILTVTAVYKNSTQFTQLLGRSIRSWNRELTRINMPMFLQREDNNVMPTHMIRRSTVMSFLYV